MEKATVFASASSSSFEGAMCFASALWIIATKPLGAAVVGLAVAAAGVAGDELEALNGEGPTE